MNKIKQSQYNFEKIFGSFDIFVISHIDIIKCGMSVNGTTIHQVTIC